MSGKEIIINTLVCQMAWHVPLGCSLKSSNPFMLTYTLWVSMGHIDDSFLVGYTRSACKLNIQHTVECFDSLGFVIHPEKSMLIPTQELEFLGFLLNSISMTIRLPPSKAVHVKSACENLLSKTKVTIRELARVIGLLVSSLPGVQFDRLHYTQVEKDKSRALQLCKGNYDGPVTLSNDSRSELEWWVNNITSSFMPITQDKPDFILTTDASKIGWGLYGVITKLEAVGIWMNSNTTLTI